MREFIDDKIAKCGGKFVDLPEAVPTVAGGHHGEKPTPSPKVITPEIRPYYTPED